MHDYVLDMLVCPVCRNDLQWTILCRNKDHIQTGTAGCPVCRVDYPVQDGIGVFLPPATRPKTSPAESEAVGVRRAGRPIAYEWHDQADPFDQDQRRSAQGDHSRARLLAELVQAGLYHSDYVNAYHQQIDYLLQRLTGIDEPIVDLASGLGTLAETLACKIMRPVIATGSDLLALRRDQQRLQQTRRCDRVSLLAAAERSLPFRDRSVTTMITNHGLLNVNFPTGLLHELRRILAGEFLAITPFYPESDDGDAAAPMLVASPFLDRQVARARFAEAGFKIHFENIQQGQAISTPLSVLTEGVSPNPFPTPEIDFDWCVLVAS